MKTKKEMKAYLAHQVACKKELTQARLAIKRVPFQDRTPEAHREMLGLGRHASVAKEVLRIAQLAYAFVCGRPYWTQERHTVHPATQYARSIAMAADADVDAVKAWLEAPVSEEERATFGVHLAQARARARERHAARRREWGRGAA